MRHPHCDPGPAGGGTPDPEPGLHSGFSEPPQKLRLAMDGRFLGEDRAMGVATYARHLHTAHRSIAGHGWTVVDGGREDGRVQRWIQAIRPSSRTGQITGWEIVYPDVFRLAQVFFDLHRRLMPIRVPGPPGLVHWSYPQPLRLVGWHNIYTVHDAIPLLPGRLSPIHPVRHRRLLAAIARSAARLVTVSRAAAAEIAAALGMPAERVADCGQAVTPDPVGAELPPGLSSDGYLLVVGTVEKRKNVAATVAAHIASGTPLPLVVAGPEGWGGAEAERAIAAASGVIRLPFVDRPTLASLVANARALLMPSLAEGFGLPIVEAMAAGTAVLTSAGGATGEVAGGAALEVDASDPAALAAGIGRIAGDAGLRARLVAAGRANAIRFTPENFAIRLRAVYATVLPAADEGGRRPQR